MTKGVQVVCTPWHSTDELLEARQWLFPGKVCPRTSSYEVGISGESDEAEVRWQRKRKACDIISAWKLRPPLPHAIESTWLLTEAILADSPSPSPPTSPTISTFSIKAGYLTALTRFVTAIVDSSQTSKYKVSMYAKAAEVGLPAMFVDLRHEATHGEMPSLVVLRNAAERGLEWLWGEYWGKLGNMVGDEGEKGNWPEEVVGMEEGGIEDEESMDEAEEVEPWGEYKGAWYPRPIGAI